MIKATIPVEFLKTYEKNCITAEDPDFLVPMKFESNDEVMTVTYNTDMYFNLEFLKGSGIQLTTKDALGIISGAVDTVLNCVNYLIFPDRLSLAPDRVYMMGLLSPVRLVFIPDGYIHQPVDELRHLVEYLSSELNISYEADRYLAKVLSELDKGMGLRELKVKLICWVVN